MLTVGGPPGFTIKTVNTILDFPFAVKILQLKRKLHFSIKISNIAIALEIYKEMEVLPKGPI